MTFLGQNEGLKAAVINTIEMASSIEANVQSIFILQKAAEGISLPADSIARLHSVRDLCLKAEQNENGSVSWRKGGPGPGNGGNINNNKSLGGAANHQNRWRKSQASSGNSSSPSVSIHPTRYVSKFINSEAPVEDKILNQVILNKLNKFSSANYEDVKAFLQQVLDSDEKGFIHDFILLVFKKAACEPTFCALYARLVAELSVNYEQLKTEFEKLYMKYMNIFEEVPESKCKDYEEFVQRNREKMHRLGYSQFLGELTQHGVLDIQHLQHLYETILTQLKQHAAEGTTKQQVIEEYVDCLLRMSNAFQNGSNKVSSLRKELGAICEPVLEDILLRRTADFPGLSKKASFAIMDCLDLFRGIVPGK
jgi:hypothetical protein